MLPEQELVEALALIDELEAQVAELDVYLHEIYHIDKRGKDENYDEWHAMCDVGEVISRYLKSRQEVKGE